MKNIRINYLQELLRQDSNDTFALYALALEYWQQEPEKAWHYLDTLLKQFPEYLPTYYQAAQYCYQEQDYAQAKQILLKGIELSQKQQDTHTKKELEKALKQVEIML